MGRKIRPPGYHVVDPGDWISKIAQWYGIPDWHNVWDDPNNARLRELRSDPNLIYPGDRVYVPAVAARDDTGQTDQQHDFRVRTQKIDFRLRLLNDAKEPRPDVPYKLTVTGQGFQPLEFEDQTDQDGQINQRIPVTSERGVLQVDNQAIRLELGHLDPIDTVSGYQARLANLGYDPGPIDGMDGPRTRKAVSAFQTDNPPLVVDGICGPRTQAKLEEVYGC